MVSGTASRRIQRLHGVAQSPWMVALLFALSCGTVACHDIEYAPRPTIQQPEPPSLTRLTAVLSPPQLPSGGGVTTVHIETSSGGSAAVPNVEVSITASSGTLSAGTVTTDSTGHGTLTWTVERTATLTIAARGLTSEAIVIVQQR